ncbi:MAG TPA: BrnA antitoxin family protein [Polyangiaceae bacterium]|nr:BrnA antitoxin family protein [Polyangiaceae bacterium]
MRKHYDFSGGRRGAVLPVKPGKTRITIRLDDDVLDWFRERVEAAGGGSYQALINDALRAQMRSEEEPLEVLVRRVVKEELRKGKAPRRSRSGKAA